MDGITYETIRVRFEEPVCFIQFYRPERNNSMNDKLVAECSQALEVCNESISIVVLEGLPDVFCFGADFQELQQRVTNGDVSIDPQPLVELWWRLATGPYVTIAHVRGKANAGGIGFVAASDIALADENAQFSLSELLFGLFPACVLPFLIRRTGFQRAHYLTLMTQPFSAQQAQMWGLVDACQSPSESLLRKHLLRLRRLSKPSIARYKKYISDLDQTIPLVKPLALSANREIFSDQENLKGILRYVETGLFPWER